MIYESFGVLRDRIEEVSGRQVGARLEIHEDTSHYNLIAGGSVVRLEGNDYFVLCDHYEGRFGLDDQPKFWVKSAIDLESGSQKVIKFPFQESFAVQFGGLSVECHRSAEKESRILEQVRGDPHFVQGITVPDRVGTPVRIIDFIAGPSLYNHLLELELPHPRYCEAVLPGLLGELIASIEALHRLHRMGLHHGDVRNDHLFIEPGSGRLVWIDFDYEVDLAAAFDVFSMGNVLTFVAGLGIHSFHEQRAARRSSPSLPIPLEQGDALLFYRYRIANLGKLFPHLPPALNEVLLRFSVGATETYRDLGGLVSDLRAALDAMTVDRPNA